MNLFILSKNEFTNLKMAITWIFIREDITAFEITKRTSIKFKHITY